MGLRFDPVGGGQFKEALKQIIQSERQPIVSLQARKTKEEARLKLFADFKGKFTGIDKTLTEFASFRQLREFKIDLGDGAQHLNVEIDKTRAEPGSYEIQINQLAKRSSVISSGFKDPEAPNLGVGYVILGMPNGDTKEIFVDSDNASLRGVAGLINKEKDCPVRAAVVKDASDVDSPWKLVMTAKKDGAADSVDFPELYFLDGDQDFYFTDTNDAQNAVIKLDGFEIQTEHNFVKDFLPGVNLTLKQADEARTFQVSITEDYQKIAGKVKGLVDQINGVLEFINKQNQVDEKTDTSTTFAGDTSLQGMEYRLRNLMHEGFPLDEPGENAEPRYAFATELGIEFDKTGMLTFKEEKFNKMMQGNFEYTAEAITGEHGLASQLKSVIATYTRPGDGALAVREKNMRERIKHIDTDIEAKEQRIARRQEALTGQFSRLQSTLSNLQKQQQYLSSTLGGGGGGNLVSQLLGG